MTLETSLAIVAGAAMFMAGVCLGWHLNRKRFTIITHKNLSEGVEQAREELRRKFAEGEKNRMDAFYDEMQKTIQQELGVDVTPPRMTMNKDTGTVSVTKRTPL